MRPMLSLAVAATLAVACAVHKPEPDDDLSGLPLGDDKTDHAGTTVLGSLAYGETSARVRYTPAPRFRAFRFDASAGDEVEIWVRGEGGADAVAWLLDPKLQVIAANDDADASTLDARIAVIAPADGAYHVVFRDYWLDRGWFRVTLAATPGCDHEGDPNRSWTAQSPEVCAVIRFTCPASTAYFADECGCGCEQDPSCPAVLNCKPPQDCSELQKLCPFSIVAL